MRAQHDLSYPLIQVLCLFYESYEAIYCSHNGSVAWDRRDVQILLVSHIFCRLIIDIITLHYNNVYLLSIGYHLIKGFQEHSEPVYPQPGFRIRVSFTRIRIRPSRKTGPRKNRIRNPGFIYKPCRNLPNVYIIRKALYLIILIF